ncbi:MAG: molybdenum cofactor biosynthesis protein [Solirubrobacteraceae bacterium]
MNVEIRLFAILRERAGADTIELELADGATVADALTELGESGPLEGLIGALQVQMAVNREYATEHTPLSPGDELALIPPLSGGQDAMPSREPELVHTLISGDPLSVDALTHLVSRPAAGAVVLFAGVTREVQSLHYEAYIEMAEEKLDLIARDCAHRHGLVAIAVEHRVGDVALGQPSVIVAASAAHREEAFAGAREVIDRIKAQAPIWKREVDAQGTSRWVPGSQPRPGGESETAA